jgi:hypothetical protein
MRRRAFRKSSFSRRFIKYLFYYRYFKYIVPDLVKRFPFVSSFMFSKFYLKSIIMQLAPNYIKLGNFDFDLNLNKYLPKRVYKRYGRSKYLSKNKFY